MKFSYITRLYCNRISCVSTRPLLISFRLMLMQNNYILGIRHVTGILCVDILTTSHVCAKWVHCLAKYVKIQV